MPIYDYRCDHCGHEFSVVRSFSDSPIDTCPSCGKPTRKLLVTPAIVFKGSGWYKTDSRKSPKGEDGGSKSDASGSDTKVNTKSETKSDAKSDSKPTATKSEGSS